MLCGYRWPSVLLGRGCAVLDRNGRKWAGFLELRSSHEAYILSQQMLGYGAVHGALRSPQTSHVLAPCTADCQHHPHCLTASREGDYRGSTASLLLALALGSSLIGFTTSSRLSTCLGALGTSSRSSLGISSSGLWHDYSTVRWGGV